MLRRQVLYSWCADETFFRTTTPRYRLFIAVVYSATAAIVTVGVATVGPLLVTALIVFPALFSDSGQRGVNRYLTTVIITGITGSIAGFLVALGLDLPPAVCAAAGVGIVGATVKSVSTIPSFRH